MDGAQVAVFEQMYHERFGGFLERLYRLALPAIEEVSVGGAHLESDLAYLASVSMGRRTKRYLHLRLQNLRGGRKGVLEAGGRLFAGSGGFRGALPSPVYSGGLCGFRRRLLKKKGGEDDLLAHFSKVQGPAVEAWANSASFSSREYQPCAAPLLRREAFGVPTVFLEVLPPIEGRPPFFLRLRGTAPVVRLPVCCFWPAIAPGAGWRTQLGRRARF